MRCGREARLRLGKRYIPPPTPPAPHTLKSSQWFSGSPTFTALCEVLLTQKRKPCMWIMSIRQSVCLSVALCQRQNKLSSVIKTGSLAVVLYCRSSMKFYPNVLHFFPNFDKMSTEEYFRVCWVVVNSRWTPYLIRGWNSMYEIYLHVMLLGTFKFHEHLRMECRIFLMGAKENTLNACAIKPCDVWK